MKLLILCLLAGSFGINVNLAFYKTKPSFLQTCNLKDKNFTKCSTNAVQKLFNGITNGLPDIGLMPIDPFEITKLKIFQGKGLVSVNALLTNVTIHGFGKTIVESNRVDPKTYDFITKIKVPKMKLEGQYSLIGQILIIPLRGLGNCWFEAKDLDIIVKSDVTTYTKEDWIFFNVTKTATKFTIGGLKLNMGNLFNGANKELEKSTNEYLNANWKLVFESLLPILNETIENIMLGIFRKVFDNIPANYFIENIKSEI